jgi:hypothetical protein
MGMTNVERRALKGNTQQGVVPSNPYAPAPIAVRIPDAVCLSGLSRSEIYRRAGRGEIILLKCGSSTLVEFASLQATVQSLPRAVIKGG